MGLFFMLKRNAKLAMHGHWAGAALILLIEMGVSGLIGALQQVAISIFVISPASNSVPFGVADVNEYMIALRDMYVSSPAEWIIIGVATLLRVLLVLPLSLGVIRWYYKIVHGGNPPITEAFHFFETPLAYGRAIWYDISVGIRTTFWALLFYFVPSAVMGVSVYYLSAGGELARHETALASAGVCLSALLFLIATFLFCAFACRYALTPYLICENDGTTVGKAVKASIKYTKGFRFSLLWFTLSFIGWALLCIFLFPIFYVTPYYMSAFAMYARYIIEKNRYAENGPEHSPQLEIPPGAGQY